jgi:hypothetical protein
MQNQPIILRRLTIRTDPKDVLRRMGEQDRLVPAGLQRRLNELVTDPEILALIDPVAIFKCFTVVPNEADHSQDPPMLQLEENRWVEATLINRQLPGVLSVAIAFCTIGEQLERYARQLAQNHQVLNSFILDAMGSAAIDNLVIEAGNRINSMAESKGLAASSPLFPGMDGLGLAAQPKFYEMVDAGRIGIRLSSGNVLYPLKSTSMVMGIGFRMPRWEKKHECARCSMAATCPYRKT